MEDQREQRPRELALFAGAGLGLWGSQLLGHQLVCAVEWDEYAQRVLAARMADGLLDVAPVWDDVRTFSGHEWRGRVDVLSAGFPCQPFSVAGRQRAGDDARNGWPHTARIIGEVRPPVAWLENVSGLATGSHGYLARVLGDLESLGYDAVWAVVSAEQAGAPHRRDRWWCLALRADADRGRLERFAERHGVAFRERGAAQRGGHAHRLRDDVPDAHCDGVRTQQVGEQGCGCEGVAPADGEVGQLANAHRTGRQELDASGLSGVPRQCARRAPARRAHWETESRIRRVADGVPHRVDRLRALGNGQVPAQLVLAWRHLWAEARAWGLLEQG